MGKLLGRGGSLIVCGVALGCGQELALPFDVPEEGSGGAPVTSGFTGLAGESASSQSDRPARLPVPDEPTFTSFGGAGGEGGQSAAAGETAAGGVDESANRGGGAHSGGTHSAGASTGGIHSGGASTGGTPAGGTHSGGASTGGMSSGGANAGGANAGGSGSSGSGNGGTSGSGGASALEPGALFFSEYVEGSGSFKALEIYAREAVSLEGCSLLTYFNGKTEPSSLALHGAVAQQARYVLCSTALAELEPTRCDRSTSLTYNGDDALALVCGDVVLDVVGQIGVDPGSAWGEGATADHTLRRNCSIELGRADGNQPFEPTSEWTVLSADQFEDLGQRDCATAP